MPENKTRIKLNWVRLLPLILLMLGLFAFFYFRLDRHLDFQTIKEHRDLLLNLVQKNPAFSVLLYIAVYTILTAISAPGAVFVTLVGGFLFGFFWGTIYVLAGATLGAMIIFIAAKTALSQILHKKIAGRLDKFASGFRKDAVSYLLFLRLVPLFPFWLVNIVPAFFNVKTTTFFFTTLIGILPGTTVYVWLGSGIGAIFASGRTPDLNIILEPNILLPLLALALLSLVPIVYKIVQQRKSKR